jgi:hypothetical protein
MTLFYLLSVIFQKTEASWIKVIIRNICMFHSLILETAHIKVLMRRSK